MTARKIGIAFRKSRHENFFQLLRSEFVNYELMEIDVNTGDRGILCSFLLFNLFVLFLCYHQVSQAIQFLKVINLSSANKQINCSKSTKETLEKYVKFVQSWQ